MKLRVTRCQQMPSNHRSELSNAQQDLLRTAVREGYFKIPRQIPLAELADKHEMSDTEASEIMRRGLDNVVRCAVLDEHSCS